MNKQQHRLNRLHAATMLTIAYKSRYRPGSAQYTTIERKQWALLAALETEYAISKLSDTHAIVRTQP